MQKKSSSQRSTVRVFALTLRAWVKLCQAFRTCQRSIPKQQQAPPAPSSFCPTKETRAQSQAAAFPGMSSAQLLPARTHTLQSLQQLLGRRLGCFFFPLFILPLLDDAAFTAAAVQHEDVSPGAPQRGPCNPAGIGQHLGHTDPVPHTHSKVTNGHWCLKPPCFIPRN